MREQQKKLLGFILLVAVATAGVYVTLVALHELGSLNPNVSAAIVAALAAVGAAIYNQRQARSRDLAESHRAQKIEVYALYMDIIDNIMELSRQGRLGEISDESAPVNLEELFRKFRRGILVWASPSVIQAYIGFLSSSKQGYQGLRQADTMFRAIRKDLGNSNWGLREGDLIKLSLKDPTEYDRIVG